MFKPALITATAAALALAPAALAAKPTHPSHPATPPAPKVTFVLRGKLSNYSAATTSTPGQVTILVSAANYHGATLKGQTLTFSLSTSSKVVLGSKSTIGNGDRGVVKLRAPKKTNAAGLQAIPARWVIDQVAAPTS